MKARVSQGRRSVVLTLTSAALTIPPLKFAVVSEQENRTMTIEQPLDARQTAIPAISAATAVGDIARLNIALSEGLDAGLSVGDCKEILVQMYAYTGFPRSLNALGELMKVVETRKQRGVTDMLGREPSSVPTGKDLLNLGTDNQTKLSGGPVKGPLFEFAPAIDTFLKAHLFGDIFARDNLDWKSRELATVGALAAMTGVESQLQAHVRISMNIGLTPAALRDAADALDRSGFPDAAKRARAAVEKQLASE
jgi:alkylhydroperoxidase/carboxymuconolactone decarboxylase family protein YurZ